MIVTIKAAAAAKKGELAGVNTSSRAVVRDRHGTAEPSRHSEPVTAGAAAGSIMVKRGERRRS
jgi:hypothetical protein